LERPWPSHLRRVLKLPEKRDANRALGSAVHAAIAENFRQKIETKEDLAVEGVVAVFRDRWQQELAEAELGEGDKRGRSERMRRLLVRTYMEQAAPSVEPAAVELHVAGEIGGVAVQGYVDVLDVNGDVVDVKTASKKPSGVRADYRVQVATYAMLAPNASGRTRLQTITKTKTVQLHTQTIDVTAADRTHATKLYQIAQEGMRSGLYAPNRSSFLCSRKYCPFWGGVWRSMGARWSSCVPPVDRRERSFFSALTGLHLNLSLMSVTTEENNNFRDFVSRIA
jgi:hypothetical protein